MPTKRTAKRKWTKSDDRTLKALARKGTKTTAMARMLRRTVGAAYQRAYHLGLSLRAR